MEFSFLRETFKTPEFFRFWTHAFFQPVWKALAADEMSHFLDRHEAARAALYVVHAKRVHACF